MELNKYIDIQPEIAEALTENLPVVALESTILSHGMPYPENLDFAAEVERTVRSEGAIPATMAIVGGRVKIGLTKDELELMCKAENVGRGVAAGFCRLCMPRRTRRRNNGCRAR